VPPHLVGRKVAVSLSSLELVVYLDGTEIARHGRSYVPADVILAPAQEAASIRDQETSVQFSTGDFRAVFDRR